LQLREWLQAHEKPFLTVATKSDKLSNNELRKNLESAHKLLGGRNQVIAYSAVTKRGRDEVWRAIEEAVTVSQSPFLKSEK